MRQQIGPGPNQDGVRIGSHDVIFGKEITHAKMDVSVGFGGASLSMPAHLFKWSLDEKAFKNALMPYIAQQIKHLPGNHMIAIKATADFDNQVESLDITVIVPESK